MMDAGIHDDYAAPRQFISEVDTDAELVFFSSGDNFYEWWDVRCAFTKKYGGEVVYSLDCEVDEFFNWPFLWDYSPFDKK